MRRRRRADLKVGRLLLGLETPSVGAVSYDGKDLSMLDVRALR